MVSGDEKLLRYNCPVPKPCGKIGMREEANWAIALSPILLSNAEVIHQPIPVFSAISIHSLVAAIPPSKDGFSIR